MSVLKSLNKINGLRAISFSSDSVSDWSYTEQIQKFLSTKPVVIWESTSVDEINKIKMTVIINIINFYTMTKLLHFLATGSRT